MKCHEMSCSVMKCHDPPLPQGGPRLRRSAFCMPFLHRVSFRLRRRRPACGAALFRAYRMGARARVRAGANAGLIARASPAQGARLPSVPLGFFAPARGGRRSGPRMPLSPCLILPQFYRGQAPIGNYFIFHEQNIASGRRHRGMSWDVTVPRLPGPHRVLLPHEKKGIIYESPIFLLTPPRIASH